MQRKLESKMNINKVKSKRLSKRMDWRVRADKIMDYCCEAYKNKSNKSMGTFAFHPQHYSNFVNYHCSGMVNPPTIEQMISIHILEVVIRESV